MNHILSEKAGNYLSQKMCICLEDLENHLSSQVPTKLPFFKKLFDFIIDIEPPKKYSEVACMDDIVNDDYINSEITSFSEQYHISKNTQEYFIIDNIRHAFVAFKSGGIDLLYKTREAENWYPKIVIRKNFRKLDVDHLPEQVFIFRGASKVELDSGNFGQSWTLCEKIAEDFAFKHYDGHKNYNGSIRVILETRIDKKYIYYYDEADNEKEVVIDERKIINRFVKVIKQEVL